MTWEHVVIDATMGARDGLFTFCPIEGDIDGDYQIVTGMNFIGSPPKGAKVVAIVHGDGQDAVNEFCERHKDELEKLSKELEARQNGQV